MYKLACLFIGYAIGCVQMAYLVGRLMGGIDIRDYGSGNAGTTNVVRILGPKAGIIVFIFDILKGMTAYVICSIIFDGGGAYFAGTLEIVPGLYGGLGAVLGHNFPLQLKFRGGKGSATTLGIIFFLDWRIALIAYISGIISVFISRYISLASMLIVGFTAIMIFAFGYEAEAGFIGVALAGLSFYQHRGNIKRLVTGTENKFNFKKQR